jgi:hypothetical protein
MNNFIVKKKNILNNITYQLPQIHTPPYLNEMYEKQLIELLCLLKNDNICKYNVTNQGEH